MVQYLFPRFLQDPAEYARAEDFWRRLWEELTGFSGQQREWQHPWLKTAYADGTPFRDGDPIFSAWSPSRKLGVRVIQNEPRRQSVELDHWEDTIGDEESGGEVRTLVISCALSREAAEGARALILSWMRDGNVTAYSVVSWGAQPFVNVYTLNTVQSTSGAIASPVPLFPPPSRRLQRA